MRLLRRVTQTLTIGVVVASLVSCDRSSIEQPPAQVDSQQQASSTSTEEERQEWSLEEADRKYLWDLEHHSNVLVKHGFASLVKALQEQDAAVLERALSDDFVGEILDDPTRIVIEDEVTRATREQQPAKSRPLTRSELVEFLLEGRSDFNVTPKVRFDVKVILPDSRDNLDGSWKSTCVMRIWGERQEGQPGDFVLMFQLTHERPTKERMAEAGWIRTLTIEQVATSTSERYLFREAHADFKIDRDLLYNNWDNDDKSQNTGGIYACDFNRDACTDLLITDINPQASSLYQGLPGGGFEDVTADVGLRVIRRELPDINAAFVDLDSDGWEDLVFARGDVFRNLDGRRLVNVTPQSNLPLHTQGIPSSSVSVVDFDRDGQMDLYISRRGGLPTSWLEDTKENPATNLLLRNLGNWKFDDVTARSRTGGDARSTFTSLWLNANDDLWPDLYVINEFGDGALYVNQTGNSFHQIDVDETTDDFGAMGASCGDIDNDGKIDLYVSSMYSKAGSRVTANLPKDVYPAEVHAKLRRLISGSEFYQNEGSLTFSPRGEAYQIHDVGWSWGPTLADFDNDGWLDLFATAGYMSRDRTKPDG